MAKSKDHFACNSCGYESAKWLGQCPECLSWGTLDAVAIADVKALSIATSAARVADVSEIGNQGQIDRLCSNIGELDRVLGGGFVSAQVVLISGEPGVGKSTLLMQVMASVSKQGVNALYVSAEESAEQVAMRARRIEGKGVTGLKIASAFEVNEIITTIESTDSKFVIIDSIQTVYDSGVRGLPGGMSQVKACSSRLVTFAKQHGVTIVMVGQITKEGVVAGPKLLEHLVDAVLTFEGDEQSGFRLLRSTKNRYGSVNEVGLFEMAEKGLIEIPDPSKYLHGNEDGHAARIGVAAAAVLEGNRVFVLDVQALIVNTPFSLPKRVAEGLTKSKIELLAAIVSKYTKISMADKDIYVNVAGGMKVKDTAVDLAVVLAMISSAMGKPVVSDLVAHGDLSLTGVVRKSMRSELREKELKRLGYKSLTAGKNFSHIRQIQDFLK